MTTIMTNIERPHYTAISPLPFQCFLVLLYFLDLFYIHTTKHLLTMNDHEHTWVPTCIIDTHLHMRAPASLSTAGSSGIYSAILLGFDDINATVLLESMLGRTFTGRSFLEEEQRRI